MTSADVRRSWFDVLRAKNERRLDERRTANDERRTSPREAQP